MTDPIVLAAQARPILQNLHQKNDVVVRFKTDESTYREDLLDDLDKRAPGHFRTDQNVLTLNLDTLVRKGKARPDQLSTIEDFRKYPVLAGVAAHEAGHARWSRWCDTDENPFPETLDNPDFDPEDPESGPENFKVSDNGKLLELAKYFEEPRIERLGTGTFTKTWRRAMQLSAGHLILEGVDELDAQGKNPVDAAIRMAVLIGGRLTAGTLGDTHESRTLARKVLENAQKIIEEAVAQQENPVSEDPYHEIMGIVNKIVFNNDHANARPFLEAARQVLKIIEPQNENDPDAGDPDEDEKEAGGPGGAAAAMMGSGETAGGEGDPEKAEKDGAAAQAMKEMADAMKEAIDKLGDEMAEMVISEEEQAEMDPNDPGFGSTLYKNPRAPQIDHHEQPTAKDRELYRRALAWMEQQVAPTVTEDEQNQWLPSGGARLDVRAWIRDNVAGHKANQRTDWRKVSETVKPAPPVKVAIMLDGSGSMHAMARPSASIAWAAANAAAMLPESRTVSVVYGNAAQVTQPPGHLPARDIAVSRTDGGTEAFIEAAKMVEEALWLDQPVEEGQPSNVLIIIVSDLQYGGYGVDPKTGKGERQVDGAARITKEWTDKGYSVLVVGCNQQRGYAQQVIAGGADLQFAEPDELFR